MQAQTDHPDLVLAVSSGIGSLVRAARFQYGVWHGYDLTHSIGDLRSHSTYGEPTSPPMDQERSLTFAQSKEQLSNQIVTHHGLKGCALISERMASLTSSHCPSTSN